MDLLNQRILITGGKGFLGRHVANALTAEGLIESAPPNDKQIGTFITFNSWQYNIVNENEINKLYTETKPTIVIHLAARVGGIGINREKPGSFYYQNLMMGALAMEYARFYEVQKFVAIGTVCAYPKFTPVPFKESDLWAGYPEETNAPYGIAKKAMLVQAQSYRQEFNFNSIYLIPVNLYGPGDNFNPSSSHVIPALIKKCVDARNAGAASIECWGTGSASREFLYVEDAAKAIVQATKLYNGNDPVNLGSGTEITIKNLVEIIAKICKFKGTIVWNSHYPDGQPRRCLDTTKAQEFGFKAQTSFEEGLAKTIEWYEREYKDGHLSSH